MRGAGDHRDLPAFQRLRPHVVMLASLARHEARRRAVIGIAEIDALAHLRRLGDRGDHRVALVLVERVDQRIEAAHLDGAGDLDLLADQPRQIDVEAGRRAVGAGIVERRIIGLGEEADDADAGEIRPFRPPARIPEAGHRHRVADRLGSPRGCRRLCRHRRRRVELGTAGRAVAWPPPIAPAS